MRKIIISKTKQYETVSTDEWRLDDEPREGSFNGITSDGVAQAIGNLGHPLQWKGPAAVAELNAGITGIQPGWTYTLTDAGTLTDGSIVVDVGDEVAWTEDGEWFKVGSETAKVKILYGSSGNPPVITFTDMISIISRGYYVILDISDTFYPFIGSNNLQPIFSNGTDKYTLDFGNTWSKTDFTAIGSVKNGGALTDGASVNVPNNALSTLATAQAALTLNVNVGANEVPNFAVEVTPSVNCTLTVTKTVGDTVTTLNPSVAGGDKLTGTRKYQVTCVGSCWTLAEFEVPA